MDGDYLNADFTYGMTIDKRNQSWNPTEGYIASFYQSLPLLQDRSSLSNNFNLSNYHDFSEDVIGSLKFRAKSIHGVDDDVRLTNRLYLKTKEILRGFCLWKSWTKRWS